VKIQAIFVKQGSSNVLMVVKKYQVLAKHVEPLAKGFLEPWSLENLNSNQESNNNSDYKNNNNNNNTNTKNNQTNAKANNSEFKVDNDHINRIRNFNQNNFEQTNSNFNNNNNNNINNFNNFSSNRAGAGAFLPLSAVSTFTKEIHMRVRVTKKFEKRTYGSGQKQGSVFSFNVIDEEGTEFPCCGFNKACENFYDKLSEGKVYEISGGYVKINDKKYTAIKSEYKYFLDDKATINEVEDDETISKINFNFKKLGDLAEMPQYSLVDVLAYVLKSNETTMIKTKKGDERQLKKIILADDSGFKIEATIWGKLCNAEINERSVYAFKNLKLSEYQRTKNLTVGDDSAVILQEDIKEALDMQLFCGEQKDYKDVSTHAGDDKDSMAGYVPHNLKHIKDLTDLLDSVEEENARLGSFKVKAVISGLALNQEKFCYEGCPSCKKKMQADESSGEYKCNPCKKSFEKPTLYYTLNFKIKDASGEIYVDVLGQVGQRVLGKTAEEIKELLDSKQDDDVKRTISQADYLQHYFLITPKMQFYNDIKRKRFSVNRIDPVDPVVETNRMVSEMMKFLH
jgi:replication factor A1